MMMATVDWRTPEFRQNMISKIEETIQQCGASMNGSDLEGQLFTKARHKEEYMNLVTRIIMHIKDKGSKKHGVGPGPGVMGQPNQLQGPGPGGQMSGQMQGVQGNIMLSQMNSMASMNQMGVNVMSQQGMVHQMQQPQLVQQMQPGMGQGPHTTTVMGGMQQQQPNQQQQHQLPPQTQGQMMSQNQMMGMSQGQLQLPQMQQIQNAQMGNPQIQQQMQMQNAQMQQALMQNNSQQMMMAGNQQQVMMQQGNQQQQTMIGGQPQMMMQGNPPQQQAMLQATSQAQQGVMQVPPQQQQAMMQGGPLQQQQGMMSGPPQQQQPGNPQQQTMMQVRGIPNPQMVANRLMTSQPNVSTALTALAHAQKQRNARPMVPNAMGIPRPEHGPNYSTNRLYYGSNIAQAENVPGAVPFPGAPGAPQMQRPGHFIPASQAQGMPSPVSSSGIGAGPLSQQSNQNPGYAHSPGSQNIMHRPPGPGVNVSSVSPFPNQMSNVPSPSTNLNTPMTMAPTPSPRNAEDQACFEKIRELKKYTDLLQRMIAKIGNEDMEKSSKMKKLLEILTNPNQRVSMEILLKCETALKKMERQQHDTIGVLGPASVSAPTPQPKDQTSPFQLLQDSVLATMKVGTSSHTLRRTVRQTVEALTGRPPIFDSYWEGEPATSPTGTTDFFSETDSDPVGQTSDNELSLGIPSVLRRELNIIDDRFQVKIIPNARSSTRLVIHVSLTEPRLPIVPPLKIFIPTEYPDESPSVIDLSLEYGATGFLNSVARTLKSRLLYLPQRFTVLELLSCWEMSVRQVCNPNYKATAASRKQMSSGLARAFL